MIPPTADARTNDPDVSPLALSDAFSEKRSVIRQMLVSLESLTIAGQRHVMAKIVGFVQDELAAAHSPRPSGQRQRAASTLEQLKREAERPLPEVTLFRERAELLMAERGLFV